MGDQIKKIVSSYIRKYHTSDPFEMADDLKIVVQDGNLGELAGCYMYLKKHRCIFINSNIEDVNIKKVVMAHELGHAILHSRTNCCFMKSKTLLLTSKIEQQANKFASELLISDEFIQQNKEYTIEQLSGISGIDIELIKLKFL